MKIIGGKDYYDSVLSYGIDESIRFIRKKDFFMPAETLPFVFPDFLKFGLNTKLVKRKGYTVELDCDVANVYFCGKLYVGICILHNYEGTKVNYATKGTTYFWNAEDFIQAIPKCFEITNVNKNEIISFFKNSGTDYLQETLIEKNITIATKTVRSYWKYEINEKEWKIDSDSLKTIDFFKLFNSFDAYNAIYDYKSNVLLNKADIEEISDEYKIKKHGFDFKKSFRKEKTK